MLDPYLDLIDTALIMTVEPGFGGQKFNPVALDKLREGEQSDALEEIFLRLFDDEDGAAAAISA